ncbi:hypothetical protein ABID22_004084 [Pontibacter aydingkolensis]
MIYLCINSFDSKLKAKELSVQCVPIHLNLLYYEKE